MKKTLTLDDELVAEATSCTGIENETALVHEALYALIQRHAARRLAELGGSQLDLEDIPRRRPAA